MYRASLAGIEDNQKKKKSQGKKKEFTYEREKNKGVNDSHNLKGILQRVDKTNEIREEPGQFDHPNSGSSFVVVCGNRSYPLGAHPRLNSRPGGPGTTKSQGKYD